MMNRTTFKQLMKPALLVALLGGMFLLATSSLLVSQQGGSRGDGSSGDHGDNPVVGSLPCAFTPELDVIFGGTETSTTFPLPVLGLVGGVDLSDQILDAGGTPYGLINRGGSEIFSILGLVNDGFILVNRIDASKGFILLQQWLPDAYLDGTISMASTIGNPSRAINSNLVDMPLQMIASASGPFVEALITIESPGNLAPALTVYISAVGNLMTVSYAP